MNRLYFGCDEPGQVSFRRAPEFAPAHEEAPGPQGGANSDARGVLIAIDCYAAVGIRRYARMTLMPGAARRLHYTYEQYLVLENESPIRHEYLDGEIYAMAGGSPDHAALAASIIRLLGPQLPPGCRAFTSDLRLRVPTTGLSTYPDVAVVCGPTERAADDAVAVVNPVLLVEVTSHATEEYDSGQKLEHYQHLPSVRAILIVSHREPHLTLHRRDETGWVVIEARQQRDIALAAVQARLSVDDVYRDGLEDVSQ